MRGIGFPCLYIGLYTCSWRHLRHNFKHCNAIFAACKNSELPMKVNAFRRPPSWIAHIAVGDSSLCGKLGHGSTTAISHGVRHVLSFSFGHHVPDVLPSSRQLPSAEDGHCAYLCCARYSPGAPSPLPAVRVDIVRCRVMTIELCRP